MSHLVVDASAILTLLLDPDGDGEAVARHVGAARLAAPDLLPHEVTNVLRRHRAARALSGTEATLAFDAFATLPVDLWPFAAVRGDVWRLTGALSGYDAAYVAVAERLGCPLLTRDRRLARAPGVQCDVVVV
ncbi:ribonuclease VapC9 [Cellulomonas chitinilytica]|uniref:Ribonuclease VapC n=1 Tax=Cellulomonas chitinilytica TaxID=398759 RepID=A0A919P7J9_9CELL|nr:type II toxin-antitoxin system VapC family toxin [Cellulomonas chitinilytica]GIG23458.1 ribonuclease VapC9 [Cellulomonas chitinilytica]